MYVEEGQDWIPKSVRAWIYRTLTVVCAFNTIFGVISSGLMSKILAAASMLGFGLASAHTPTKDY